VAGADHSFSVVAVDEAGNVSVPSAPAAARTWDVGVLDVTTVPLPAGDGVTVTVGDKTFVFEHVEVPGDLQIVLRDPAYSDPANFWLVRGEYYEIHTSAEFSGLVTLTFPYDDAGLVGQEKNLKLFHWKDNGWHDVTLAVDTEANTITAIVDSFSPFAVQMPRVHPVLSLEAEAGVPIAYGASVPLRATLRDDAGHVLSGRPVVVEQSFDGKYWAPLEGLDRAAPTRRTSYRLVFRGDEQLFDGTSDVLTLTPAAGVAAPVVKATDGVAKVGFEVLTGGVEPKKATLTVEQLCGKTWRTVRTETLKPQRTAEGGSYQAAVKVGPGEWRFTAGYEDKDHAPTTSPRTVLRVK
jgi:hypothetical protein